MIWFQRLFPVLMILFPAAFTLFVPKVQRGTLIVATAVALAAFAAGQWTFESAGPVPTWFTVVVPIVAFQVLWFGFAVRALRAADPSWGCAHAVAGETRGASLKPRGIMDDVPAAAWNLGWAAFVVCAALLWWAITKRGMPVLSLLSLMWWVPFAPILRGYGMSEAEPLDAEGSPEILDAYARLRRFKAWGFYGMCLGGLLLCTATFVVGTFAPGVAVPMGVGVGVTWGIGGGVFGTVASVRRARINKSLHDYAVRAKRG